MDIEECITAYNSLMKTVFSDKFNKLPVSLMGDIKPQFDSATLERAINEVITSCGVQETALLDDGVVRSCRV